MISFLSSPKPFIGIVGENQRRAISNWMSSVPEAEVIIYGDAPGTAEVCQELGAIHIPQISCSSSGVPYYDAIAAHAAEFGRYDLQVYCNCDILFANETLIKTISNVNFDSFLLIGQRIDLNEGIVPNTKGDMWLSELTKLQSDNMACVSLPHAKDYFIFKRGFWNKLKPLVIGRGGYDDALVAYALRKQIPVVDCTLSIVAFHQFHDYGHVPSGKKQVMRGEDAARNMKLHSIVDSFRNSDSDYQIQNGKILPNHANGDWLRYLELFARFRLKQEWSVYPFRVLWHTLVRSKLYKARLLALSDIIAMLDNQQTSNGGKFPNEA